MAARGRFEGGRARGLVSKGLSRSKGLSKGVEQGVTGRVGLAFCNLAPVGRAFLPTPKQSPAFLHIARSAKKLESQAHLTAPPPRRPPGHEQAQGVEQEQGVEQGVGLALFGLLASLAPIGRPFLPTPKQSPLIATSPFAQKTQASTLATLPIKKTRPAATVPWLRARP